MAAQLPPLLVLTYTVFYSASDSVLRKCLHVFTPKYYDASKY